MKKNFYTIGSIIVLVLIAVAFVLPFNALDSNAGNQSLVVGSYKGKKIRYEANSDFTNKVAQYAEMYKQMGYQVDTSTYYYIFSNAFNETVQHLAYADAVKKTGWEVPESSVNRAMVPYFSDENGNYSSRLYKQADTASVTDLRNQIEKALFAGRYYDDIYGAQTGIGSNTLFGVKTPAAETAFIESLGQTERAFDMATFSLDNYPDSEKIAYGEANKEKFAQYDMSVITVASQKDADSIIRQMLNNSITFEDAVSANSQKSYSDTDGKLNQKYFYQLEKIISTSEGLSEVLALEVGQTSGVVKTGDNFSIFRADGAVSPADFTDDETVREVFSYLNNYEAGIIEDYYLAEAKRFTEIAAEQNFANACREFGVERNELSPFPINYGNVSVLNTVNSANVPSANTNEQFLKTAFSLQEGEISEPIVIGQNIVVLRLNAISEREAVNTESTETAEAEGENATSIPSQLNSYDMNSAETALMNSPKIQNNVMDVFFNNFLN